MAKSGRPTTAFVNGMGMNASVGTQAQAQNHTAPNIKQPRPLSSRFPWIEAKLAKEGIVIQRQPQNPQPTVHGPIACEREPLDPTCYTSTSNNTTSTIMPCTTCRSKHSCLLDRENDMEGEFKCASCPYCHESYKRDPPVSELVSLSCGHSFLLECLIRKILSGDLSSKCPVCDKTYGPDLPSFQRRNRIGVA